MKLLYHHRTRSRDGQRVHIDGLVGALRRAGHEVVLVGPGESTAQRATSGGGSGDPGPPRASGARELAELAYNFVERARLHAAARRLRPDAIYSRHALFCSSAVAVAQQLRLPVVVEVNAPLARERAEHGGLRFESFARRHETATLNRAGRVVVVTQVLAERLVAQGVARARLEVHWNGLEPEALRAPGDGAAIRARLKLEGRLVLGFVGFVRDWNRLERVFPFLARHAEAVLLLVGEGPDRPRLLREAERLRIVDRVRFLGTLARAEVLANVAAFDVALLPEVTEYASPLKLLDYLAAGRAIVAPDRANLREVLTDGENASLFDPVGVDAFDSALERVAASRELRVRLGGAARATIERRGLTWDANAARVVRLVEGLRAGVACDAPKVTP